MEYVFIAVNYNGSTYTESFIKSVNKIVIDEDDTISIVIVDNNSSTEDVKMLESLENNMPNVTLIKSTENTGYFGGLNIGLDSINNKDKKVIQIGNNDLTFDTGFINAYKKINYANDIYLIAPNIITKEGRQQNPHVVTKVSKFEKLKNEIYFSNYYVGQGIKLLYSVFKNKSDNKIEQTNNHPEMVIKRGIGAWYILTKNFFDKFDKLDDKVFLWGEEAVLTNQIEKYDGNTLYAPSLRIVHHESASVKVIESREKYKILRESYKSYRKYL